MNLDAELTLLEALSSLSDDDLRKLEREHREAFERVAPDLVEAFERERAHREAQRLEEQWDKAIETLRKLRQRARNLAAKYPRYIILDEEPELPATPDTTTVPEAMAEALEVCKKPAVANPQPEPEPEQSLSLTERMARAGRALAARRRWAT